MTLEQLIQVREIAEHVRAAVALATGPLLMPADLFPELRNASIDRFEEDLPLSAVRDAAEKRQIEYVLRETEGQTSEAARRLNISRTTLWEKMRRFGLGSSYAS